MSSLWTPGGERPVGRPPAAAPPSDPVGDGPPEPGSDEEAALAAHLAELRRQLVATPVEVVVANHAYGLFELAAIHLSEQPPSLEAARVAVDGLAALVEALAGRLGDAEPSLHDALAQIRLAYVQIAGVQSAGNGEAAEPPAG